MSFSMNRFDRSWLRRQGTGALFASLALLPVSYAAQPTYRSPEDAVRELYVALRSNDEPALLRILSTGEEIVSSGDAAADTLDRQQIVQKYQEMHRLARQSNGTMVLYIGAENWPFPIPLVASNGVWRFDSETGAEEVHLRQIGEDEVTAIQMCHALVERQGRAGMFRQTSTREEAGSLLETLLAASPDANEPALFRGYNFRVLTKSHNGFTAVAYPAAYGFSGIMTFVVNGRDVVYEKDLGPTGTGVAQDMSKVRLDSTWKPAD
jgi:hypothetical protein